jgi:hypothetical protein
MSPFNLLFHLAPFRRAENPLAAQNCMVVNYAGLCLKPATWQAD